MAEGIGQFSQHLYEPDGDSVMSALLPDIHVSRVTLEEDNTNISNAKTFDRDPHIKTGQAITSAFTNIPESAGSDEETTMKVSVDFIFKEKIENDDVSLFTIPQIINSVKVAIYYSVNLGATNYINQSGDSAPLGFAAGSIYLPQRTARFLGKDEYGTANWGTLDNIMASHINAGNIIRKEYKLSEISQFNSLFSHYSNAGSLSAGSDSFLSQLKKTTLGDGTTLYDIPFSDTISIPSEKGGINAQHLTVFAVCYISVQELMDSKSKAGSQQWAGSKMSQFAEIGYEGAPVVMGTGLAHFEKFLTDYGVGIPCRNKVLEGGKVNNSNQIFVIRGIEEEYADLANKVWYGDVHYHPPQMPAPDGYVGYMGGKTNHMNSPTNATPKLKVITADSSGEIVDYRKKKYLEEKIFNYADFNFGNFIGNLGKQTTSNSWIKPNQSVYFSNPIMSIRRDGSSNFYFSFDIHSAIKDNAAFPTLVQGLTDTERIIKDIKIHRYEVTSRRDDKGKHIEDKENSIPKLISEAADVNGRIPITSTKEPKATKPTISTLSPLTTSQPIQAATGFATVGTSVSSFGTVQPISLKFSEDDLGTISELSLFTNNNSEQKAGKRHFAVADRQIKNELGEQKYFQYEVEIDIIDPSITRLNSKLAVVQDAVEKLKEYSVFASENPKYYNTYSNTFTELFVEKFIDPASGIVSTPFTNAPNLIGKGQGAFLGSSVFTNLMKFLNQVFYPLSNITSSSEQGELTAYMISLISPIYGNPNGIQTVLSHLQLFEKELRKIIDSKATSRGSKATTYAENTLASEIDSKKGKAASGIITVKTRLNGTYDFNSSGENGYEYIFDKNKQVDEEFQDMEPFTIQKNAYENASYPISSISFAKFQERTTFERKRFRLKAFYNTPTMKAAVPAPHPSNNLVRFFTPLGAKVENTRYEFAANNSVKKKFVHRAQNIDAAFAIFQFNSQEEVSLNFKSGGDNHATELSGLTNVMADLDISFQRRGTGFRSFHPSAPSGLTSPSAISNSESGLQKYSDSTLEQTANNYGLAGKNPLKGLRNLSRILCLMDKTDAYFKFSYDNLKAQILDYITSNILSPPETIPPVAPKRYIPSHVCDLIDTMLLIEDSEEHVGDEKRDFQKFGQILTMSLLHKNLIELEFLSHFKDGDLNDPVFLPLSAPILNAFNNRTDTNERLLIKIKEYDKISPFVQTKDLKLPIFNNMFLIS